MKFDKANIRSFPKKSLGQNFLVDDNTAKKIINAMDFREDDLVLEIGPGYGSLTKHILNKTKNIICIELDKEISDYLTETYHDITVINDDFLNINLLNIGEAKQKKLRIIGNIPYNITSRILFHIIDNRIAVSDALIMMQLDVAERIVAKPRTKEYGILSVFSQAYSSPELLFKISPQCFFPRPRVFSGMVHFNFAPNGHNEIIDDDFFRKLVRTTFGKRRKILNNTLKELELKININELDLPLNKRPEELSVNDFINLSNKLSSGQ